MKLLKMTIICLLTIIFALCFSHKPEPNIINVTIEQGCCTPPNVEIKKEEVEIAEKPKTFELTAYCSCEKCCGKSDGITATGTKATEGRTIAVDPKTIPYGTEVIINGHTYVAEDCGGAIKGNRIDVYFDSHDEALAFGRQTAEIYIV
jgi:3D (Asp-Asp-Asp) domain-containing protein